MKHIKIYEEFSNNSFSDKVRESGDLSEISNIIRYSGLFDNLSGFSLDWYEPSHCHCLDYALNYNHISQKDYDYLWDNSIVFEIYDPNTPLYLSDQNYHIETEYRKYEDEINSRLEFLGYKIAFADFGVADCSYELVVCNKDFTLSPRV